MFEEPAAALNSSPDASLTSETRDPPPEDAAEEAPTEVVLIPSLDVVAPEPPGAAPPPDPLTPSDGPPEGKEICDVSRTVFGGFLKTLFTTPPPEPTVLSAVDLSIQR